MQRLHGGRTLYRGAVGLVDYAGDGAFGVQRQDKADDGLVIGRDGLPGLGLGGVARGQGAHIVAAHRQVEQLYIAAPTVGRAAGLDHAALQRFHQCPAQHRAVRFVGVDGEVANRFNRNLAACCLTIIALIRLCYRPGCICTSTQVVGVLRHRRGHCKGDSCRITLTRIQRRYQM